MYKWVSCPPYHFTPAQYLPAAVSRRFVTILRPDRTIEWVGSVDTYEGFRDFAAKLVQLSEERVTVVGYRLSEIFEQGCMSQWLPFSSCLPCDSLPVPLHESCPGALMKSALCRRVQDLSCFPRNPGGSGRYITPENQPVSGCILLLGLPCIRSTGTD